MKNSTKWFVIAGLATIAGSAVAQKTIETSAAVEFKNKYQPALYSADMEAAKKSLLKAKEYIDQASAHPDTKESAKTLYYKGEIYSAFLLVGMQSADTVFLKKAGDDALDVAIAAYKKGYEVSDKFDEDIRNAIGEKKGLLESFTSLMFANKLYKDAIEIYDYQVKLSSAINIIDTSSYYNAGICSERSELWEKAADYYKICAGYGYPSPEIYKTVAITLIKAGKKEEATTFLNQAIAKNPKDQQLYYALGSMYMENGETDKAIESLKKAVSIDPTYLDAQYQLGAFLLEQGTKKRNEANNLSLKDPNFDKLIAQSTDYYSQAVNPLETYIAKMPDDVQVLTCLYQIHRALKNADKEAEYKGRLDKLKK